VKPLSPLLRQVAGWSLIALGLLGSLVPVMPGMLFIAAGVLLLARHVRAFRRVSAWVHKHVPRLRGPLRRFRDFKQRHAHYTTIDSNVVSAENDLAKPTGREQSAGDKNTDTPR
jgi:uncharacterized membrane protein YbaN (DUF454 family)